MQVKLLRVLQEKHITRVGDNREIPVNVRVISATHVDLEEAVREKRFREDLYFRIQVLPLELPPLRDRGQDVVLLAENFIQRYGAEYGRGKFHLSRNAEKALLGYHWPGNVRELENRVQKGLAGEGIAAHAQGSPRSGRTRSHLSRTQGHECKPHARFYDSWY